MIDMFCPAQKAARTVSRESTGVPPRDLLVASTTAPGLP